MNRRRAQKRSSKYHMEPWPLPWIQRHAGNATWRLTGVATSAVFLSRTLKLFAAALDVLACALYRVATCKHHQHGRTRESHEFANHDRLLLSAIENKNRTALS